MSVPLLDRILAARVEAPGRGTVALGRYQVADAARPIFLNGFAAQDGTYVVPDADGRFRLLTGEGEAVEGVLSRGQQIEDLNSSSILSVGESVSEALEWEAPWLQWLDLSPLVPEMSKRVEMQELEALLEKRLGHLEEVCRRPRAHLRVEVERLAVSRARRFDTRAASFLAAHTEDWDRPTLRSVVPKRILSLVRDDQPDIYENRVAARLADHLLAYLNRRIHEVSSLLQMFKKAEEAQNYTAAAAGSHWRQGRIYSLWGQSLDAHEERRKAEHNLQRLRHLKYTVAGLMDSVLYREVPLRATVSTTLKTTNILAGDVHYKRVAELWLAWARLGQSRPPRPRELFDEHQRLCEGFASYCLLLMVRALEQLGFEPEGIEQPLRRDEDLVLRRGNTGEPVTLRFSSTDGIVALRGRRGLPLRVVPLASSLATMDPGVLRAFLEEVDAGASADWTTVVVYPTPGSEAPYERLGRELAHRLQALPHELAGCGRHRAGFLPVSPSDIGSVERFARLIRWVTLAPMYRAYPPRLDRPSGVELDPGAAWIEVSGNTLSIRRVPSDHENEALNLEQRLEDAIMRLESLKSDRERVSGDLRAAHRNREGTGELNATKKRLHADITEAESHVAGLQRLIQEVAAAQDLARALLQCPTCGKVVDARRNFEAGPGSRFRCECIQCGSTWRTVMCPHCQQWTPVLLPRSRAWMTVVDRRPGWLDRVLGADVLGAPCPHGEGETSFVCCECGGCGCGVARAGAGD